MPEGNVEIVRGAIVIGDGSNRRPEERLALRFPRVLAFLARAIWRLPRRSRFRRALIRRMVVTGWEAMNRVDLEVGLALYDQDVESIFDPGWIALGFRNSRGREERFRTLTRFYAEARGLRFEPAELIEVGDDRLLVIGRMRGSGLNSGAPFDNEWANLVTISAGLVVRDQVFMNHREALEAIGLSE